MHPLRLLHSFFSNQVARRWMVSSFLYPLSLKAHFKNWKYVLGVVAIVKNEGSYLDEWFRFHLCMGVQHFYLYDNESDDDTFSIIQKYVMLGVATYSKIPGRGMQCHAYTDACKKYWRECKYLAFIDADEFLYSTQSQEQLPQVVESLCTKYNVAGIAIPWKMFGSSNHATRPKGGVVENYVYRARLLDRTIKSVVQANRVFLYNHPHIPLFYKPYYEATEGGERVFGPFLDCQKVSSDIICINHYVTKSKEEYYVRKRKGRVDDGRTTSDDEIDSWYQTYNKNEVLDLVALSLFEG